jgi:hypothetical protein
VLQRLSRAELADRLVYSTELAQRIAKAALPAQKRTLTQEIIAMMRAQPRSATESDVAQRIAKAASVPNVDQGAAIRRSAQQLLDEQPPAPRNPDAGLVVKAAAEEDGLMLCCDEAGAVIGVCLQSALTPVLLPSEIAKATTPAHMTARAGTSRNAKAPPPGHLETYDKDGKFTGYVKPGDIADPATAQARNTGPVNAGGTTGLGLPRNAPQTALPGDATGRQVVKAAQRAPVRTATGRIALLRDLPPRKTRRAG